jgi:membrane associated rhomboid family serine protease
MFGDNVEDVVGPVNLALAYLAAGVAATLSFGWLSSLDDVPVVGASGAISGVVGMYLAFFPKKPMTLIVYVLRVRVKELSVTARTATLAWFAEQLLLGLGSKALGMESYVRTAFVAHAGGFVAGCAIGAAFVRLGFIRRYEAGARRSPFLGYVA